MMAEREETVTGDIILIIITSELNIISVNEFIIFSFFSKSYSY